jgi:hypothetical protein
LAQGKTVSDVPSNARQLESGLLMRVDGPQLHNVYYAHRRH